MKIQQHDGVVVDAGRHSSRASPRLRGRDVTGGGGGARGWCMKSLLSPTIYSGGEEGLHTPAPGASTSPRYVSPS